MFYQDGIKKIEANATILVTFASMNTTQDNSNVDS
jgi:hypothetical protein